MRSMRKKKMSPVRTVYVPCFSSQPGSSQRDLTDLIMEQQTEAPCQDKRGKVRGVKKTRFVLKVKLPTVNKKGTKEDKTRRRRTPEPASKKTKTTVSRGGGQQCVGADSDAVGDAFSFLERPTSKAMNEKEKAKLAVLRTISKVLEENQLIRQRLSVLSQAS